MYARGGRATNEGEAPVVMMEAGGSGETAEGHGRRDFGGFKGEEATGIQ